MTVLRGDPTRWRLDGGGSAVTIGVYDGVHRGHQAVLRDLESRADEVGADRRVVLTFEPHPLSVVAPDRAPKLLTTIERRIEILESLGVDVVGVLPFRQIRQMHPGEFIERVLVAALHARLVVVGTNFRFGLDREGDVATLRRAGARFGFDLDAVELLRGDGTSLSSSAIRAMLARGEVRHAAEALGRLFELPGTVVTGDGRGRQIGFPTANLAVPSELMIPADGVYAVWAEVAGGRHRAVVNIGTRPTFDGGDRVVEAHLLGVDQNLYGFDMRLEFVDRLRGERRFASVDELVDQIRRDIEVAEERL